MALTPAMMVTSRQRPIIIRVPPPAKAGRSRREKAIIAAVISALVVASAAYWFTGWVVMYDDDLFRWMLIVVLGWVAMRRERQFRAKAAAWRREFRDRMPEWEHAPIAARLLDKWHRTGMKPSGEDVLATLNGIGSPQDARAHVVCVGPVDVPEIGEHRFEPAIITPAACLWRLLWPIPFILTWFLLIAAEKHYLPFHVPRRGLGLWVMLAVGLAALWLWHAAVRPTYVRLAPGVVQVLRFSCFGDRPSVVDTYPIEPGTVVVVSYAVHDWLIGSPAGLSFTFMQGSRSEQVKVWCMRKSDHTGQLIWSALLSTAPTPPLTEEGLVG